MVKFELGQTVMTRGVAQFMDEHDIPPNELAQFLAWHSQGNWGNLDDEDKQANDEALTTGGRIFSAYTLRGEKVWVITEAEVNGAREYTTVLFPHEY